MKHSRIVGVWLVLAGLMVVNGILRVAILSPLLGRSLGDVISPLLGMVIVIGASRPFLHESEMVAESPWRVSIVWVLLTIAFEIVLGRATGSSWSAIGGAYAIWNGELWPLVVLCVAAAPFVWAPRPNRLSHGGSLT
jgi:hypothetical protein